MPPRRSTAALAKNGRTPWGAVDWSHAPAARFGTMGVCVYCGCTALLRHPLTGKPCHKTCDDAKALPSTGSPTLGASDAGTSG